MENIFSTRQRIKILQTILFKTNSISVNNIAIQLRLSKGLISKYFDILVRKEILKKVNGKFFVTDFPLVKGVKILLNIRGINFKVFKKYPFIKTVGLYGSCAKGENTEDSDVDLWIKLKNISEEKLAPVTSELNKKMRNIKLLFLTNERVEKIKKEDSLFYHSLVFSSIVLYGDKDGIQV